jgi:adenosylhomocysteinase
VIPTPALRDARIMVRRFARATNMVLAGSTFAVITGEDDGSGDYAEYTPIELAEALHTVLEGCGARFSPRPRVAFACSGGAVSALTESRPMVIADVHGRLTDRHGSRLSPPILRANIPFLDGSGVVDSRIALAARMPLPPAEGRIRWAQALMQLSRSLVDDLTWSGLLMGHRLGVSMVLEPKTAALAIMLRGAGADVAVFSHHYETDDDVAAMLHGAGVPVFADASGNAARDRELALAFLDTRPEVLIDDGAHVIRLALAERADVVADLIGAAEETTSGIRALRALGDALTIPVIAVNDAFVKTRFDNRYGTGQSCVFAVADVMEQAGLRAEAPGVFEGAKVVVLGFGPVGQGVAQYAAALGAVVFVGDLDPRAELDAQHAGYYTGPIEQILDGAHIVISATGAPRTVTVDLARAADGAVLAVAGGVADEIELSALRPATTAVRVTGAVERLDFPGGERVYLLAGGECINIAAGEGNPVEIMDLSFAAQLEAVRVLLEGADSAPLSAGLHPLPGASDRRIADRVLRGVAEQTVGEPDRAPGAKQ